MGVRLSAFTDSSSTTSTPQRALQQHDDVDTAMPSFFPSTYATPTIRSSQQSPDHQIHSNQLQSDAIAQSQSNAISTAASIASNNSTSSSSSSSSSGLLSEDVLGDEKLTLQICIAGVKAAMAEGKYERAAMYLSKHFDLADRRDALAAGEQDASTMAADQAFFLNLANVEVEVLDHEAQRVRDVVSERLASAVARGAAAETLRLCRLFAALRYTEEGLIDYYHHLQQRFVSSADKIFTRLTQQQQQKQASSGGDNIVFKQITDDDDDDVIGDADARLSCSDALTELFECVARTIDDQHNLYGVDVLFGHGSERFVIGNLQSQCDKWASRIYQYFLQQIDLGRILQRVHASGNDAAQAERLDPRVLTDLLEELALMSRCTEFYLRFVRQRAANAANAILSESDAATPRGVHTPLAMAADTYLQEIRSYYVAFEEYFLAESVTRAIAMGREEAQLQQRQQLQQVDQRRDLDIFGDADEGTAVSVVVEYVFFVLQHCTRRALLTASVRNVCQVLYLLKNALDLEYKKCLQDGWLDSLRHFRRLEAIASSKLTVVSNDAVQHFDQCVVIANDIDESSEYIARLRDEVDSHVRTVFGDGAVTKSDAERLKLCIQELTSASNAFATLAEQCIGTLFDSVLPRIQQLVAEHTGSGSQKSSKRNASASARDGHGGGDDEYILPMGALDSAMGGSVVAGALLRALIELVLVQYGRGFTPRNSDRLCVRLTRHLGEWLLDRATTHSFSLAGGVLFAREVSEVVRVLSRRCNTQTKSLAVVAAMARAQAAAEILSCANATDALDYFFEDLVASLDAQLVANLVARRVDFGEAADAVRKELLDIANGKPRQPKVAPAPIVPATPPPRSQSAAPRVNEHLPMGAALLGAADWQTPPRRQHPQPQPQPVPQLAATPVATEQIMRAARPAPLSAPPRSAEARPVQETGNGNGGLTPMRLDFSAMANRAPMAPPPTMAPPTAPLPAPAAAGNAVPWWQQANEAPLFADDTPIDIVPGKTDKPTTQNM